MIALLQKSPPPCFSFEMFKIGENKFSSVSWVISPQNLQTGVTRAMSPLWLYFSTMLELLYTLYWDLPCFLLYSTLIYTNIILALLYTGNSLNICRQELHGQCLHYGCTSLCWYFPTSLQTAVIRAMPLPIILGEHFYYLWGRGDLKRTDF